jgi:hypothetical protein
MFVGEEGLGSNVERLNLQKVVSLIEPKNGSYPRWTGLSLLPGMRFVASWEKMLPKYNFIPPS